MAEKDSKFFERLSKLQKPKYLWIGCSDSRVPANEIVGLLPGELFVHRNIANQVIHADINCLSVIEYAVKALKVEHIIVTGHYSCGGVIAALNKKEPGISDNWLHPLKQLYIDNEQELLEIKDMNQRVDRLCELNTIKQVQHVCHTRSVQEAWENGQKVHVHGWIYNLNDGRLNDLNVTCTSTNDVEEIFKHY